MKYANILMAVAAEIWAMQPEKVMAMIDFLALQAEGVKFDAAEIEARIGGRSLAAPTAQSAGDIAVLPLRGVISPRVNLMSEISGGTSAEAFGRAAQSAHADDSVKAIVLDVDSPGGNVHLIEETAALIHGMRGSKPIVAQVSATAASAAYWIASAADEIVVTPSGWVGSIGAMTVHEDISAALEKAGVKRELIGSSQYKGERSAHLPLTDELRAHLRDQVNTYDAMFTDRVAANRNVASATVRETYGMGRMVLARQAVAQGMADRVGTMAETLQRLSARSAPQRQSFASARERRKLALI